METSLTALLVDMAYGGVLSLLGAFLDAMIQGKPLFQRNNLRIIVYLFLLGVFFMSGVYHVKREIWTIGIACFAVWSGAMVWLFWFDNREAK